MSPTGPGLRQRAEEFASGDGLLVELLLPRTDAGVLAQLVMVLGVGGVVLWRLRGDRDLFLFVGSALFLLLSLFGLRAAH